MSLLPQLDSGTSYLFGSAVQIGVAVAVLALTQAQKTYAGFDRWASAFIVAAAGFALAVVRDQTPPVLGVLVANLLLMLATPLQVDGILLFLDPPGIRTLRQINAATCAAWGVLFLACFAIWPDRQLQQAAVSGAFATGAVLAVIVIIQSKVAERIPALKFLIACYVTEAALHTLRILVALFVASDGMLLSQPSQAAGALISTLILTLKAFGLVALNSQRYEEELRGTHRDLEQLAATDSLTKLRNRRAFLEQGAALFAFAQRHERSLGVLAVDIDHFKRVNDRYGHPAGDRVLVMVAEVMTATLRRSDLIGRLGGEEFGVILMESGREAAELATERLRRAIAAIDPPLPGAERITISIGLAMRGVDTPDLNALLEQADEALYKAKQAGRNCWVLAD